MSLVGATPHSSQSGPHSSLEARFTALEGLYRQAIAEIADMRAREALKTQFLANISHDLRTPLTAVITHAEILRDGMLGELHERQIESIKGIIAGGRQYIYQAWWIMMFPILVIVATVLGLNAFGDGLRAATDPVLQR